MQEERTVDSAQCDEMKWVGFKEQTPLWASHHRRHSVTPHPLLAEFNIKYSLRNL